MPSHAKTAKVTVVMLLAMVAMFAPSVLWSVAGLEAAAGISVVGAMSGALAMTYNGLRPALLVSVAVGVASAIAVAVSAAWLPAAALFVCLGLLIGWAGAKGWASAFGFVAISAGFSLGEHPLVSGEPVVEAVLLGLVMGSSALFAAGVVLVVLRRPMGSPIPALNPARARAYGLFLGLALGVGAGVVAGMGLAHAGAWLILTIVVVMQPHVNDSVRKTVHRTAGTFLGFAVSLVLDFLLPYPPVLGIVAGVAVIAALALTVNHRPYWMYTTCLTVAIVILESTPGSFVETAEERLAATIGGALLALAVTGLAALAYRVYVGRRPAATATAPAQQDATG